MVEGVQIIGAKGKPAGRKTGRDISLKLRPGDGRLLKLKHIGKPQTER